MKTQLLSMGAPLMVTKYTLYVHYFQQFCWGCKKQTTIDFIFRNAMVVFQESSIIFRMHSMPIHIITNIVSWQPKWEHWNLHPKFPILALDDLFSNSSNVKRYLGRTWKMYSQTVHLESYNWVDAVVWG